MSVCHSISNSPDHPSQTTENDKRTTCILAPTGHSNQNRELPSSDLRWSPADVDYTSPNVKTKQAWNTMTPHILHSFSLTGSASAISYRIMASDSGWWVKASLETKLKTNKRANATKSIHLYHLTRRLKPLKTRTLTHTKCSILLSPKSYSNTEARSRRVCKLPGFHTMPFCEHTDNIQHSRTNRSHSSKEYKYSGWLGILKFRVPLILI